MNQVIFLLLVSCFQIISAQRPFNDLRARFSVDPTQGFYELPQTTNSSEIEQYVLVPENFNLPVNVYCYPNDPRVCLMYDYNGYAAGIQISFLFDDVAGATQYNYSSVGAFQYSNIFNQSAWGFRVYFTNPETLTAAGRKNVNEVVEGAWVYLNNQLVQLQRPEPSPTQLTVGPFNRQNCFPKMGQHYFNNMNTNVPCEELVPMYALYEGGGLVGFGIAEFGRSSFYQRMWYETPPLPGVDDIIVNRPACANTWIQQYGLYSLHVYFVDQPWNITCPSK